MRTLLQSIVFSFAAFLSLLQPPLALADIAIVKYRGPVPLDRFTCVFTPSSSVIGRICYDKLERYMIVLVRQTYYHYCEVDAATVAAFVEAPSAGKFYNRYVRDDGSGGLFDCRTHHVPEYP